MPEGPGPTNSEPHVRVPKFSSDWRCRFPVLQIIESVTGPLLRVSDLACMIILLFVLICPFPFFAFFFSAEGRFLPDVVGLARTGATLLLLLWRMGQWRWILLGLVPCWTGGSSSFRSTRCRVFGLCSMDPPPISRPRGGTGLAGRLPRSVDHAKESSSQVSKARPEEHRAKSDEWNDGAHNGKKQFPLANLRGLHGALLAP